MPALVQVIVLLCRKKKKPVISTPPAENVLLQLFASVLEAHEACSLCNLGLCVCVCVLM